MNLDKIQEMWQKDSVIDPDNLHDESLKIPQGYHVGRGGYVEPDDDSGENGKKNGSNGNGGNGNGGANGGNGGGGNGG